MPPADNRNARWAAYTGRLSHVHPTRYTQARRSTVENVTVADAPLNWPDPPPVSMLETLLVFVGIPLLAIVVISLLVLAPSLAKGPRFGPGQPWDAAPEWFGAAEPDAAEPAAQRPQLTGSTRAIGGSGVTGTGSSRVSEAGTGVTGTGSNRVSEADPDTGGASVRW